jgi:phosphoribosylformylglycinamidine synthase subunit PurQ / glutaminase
MKFGVVVFPGSNCDKDCMHVAARFSGQKVAQIWHKETKLPPLDCVIVPGGFSYGDYLRAGALARFSPVMKAVADFANKGGLLIGICNGFQILIESGLLPGALMRNASLKFICDSVDLKVENAGTSFTHRYRPESIVRMPIAHMDGNYFADKETLKELEGEGRIIFRYHESNPNGSRHDIAGICNESGNVLGMMPHPERVTEDSLGGVDGSFLFQSLVEAL